jgi:cytoskeletal protein CcmA (bactofilin family)
MFRIGNTPESEQPRSDRNKDRRPHEFQALHQSASPSSGAQNPDAVPATSPATSTAVRAIPESESLAREIKDGSLSGYVGHGTVVTGEARFKGMMRIDGHVAGKLVSEGGTVIVGDGGQVDANLEVSVAMIRGTVNGDIIATQRVELGRTAKVHGDIHTASISIDLGAFFEGSCRMAPIPKQVEKGKPESERPRIHHVEDYGAMAASLNAAVGDDLDTPSFTDTHDAPN